MTTKKLLSCILSAMLAGSLLLTACSTSGASSTAPASGTSNVSEAVSSAKPVTITVNSWRTEDSEAFAKINEMFHQEHPNITVKYEPIKNTEYDSQIKIALQTGEGADIIYSRNYDAGRLIMDSGYLHQLTPEMIPALAEANPSYLDAFTTTDGKVFALPGAKTIQGFLYNKKIFDQHGLTEPKTWDEFFALCEALQSKSLRPMAVGFKDGWTFAHRSFQLLPSFISGNPEEWRQDLIAGKTNFTDDAFVQHLEMLNKMKPYFGNDFVGLGYVESQQLFITEQAAIFPGGSFEVAYFRQMNPDLELGVFCTPTDNPDRTTPLATVQSWGYSINKNTKNLDACVEYLNWLTTPAATDLMIELLPGMPPMVPSSLEVKDPIMQKWNGFAGEGGKNIMIFWGVEALNAETPGAQSLVVEGIQKMLMGELSPADAAAYVQTGMETWYPPFKK